MPVIGAGTKSHRDGFHFLPLAAGLLQGLLHQTDDTPSAGLGSVAEHSAALQQSDASSFGRKFNRQNLHKGFPAPSRRGF